MRRTLGIMLILVLPFLANIATAETLLLSDQISMSRLNTQLKFTLEYRGGERVLLYGTVADGFNNPVYIRGIAFSFGSNVLVASEEFGSKVETTGNTITITPFFDGAVANSSTRGISRFAASFRAKEIIRLAESNELAVVLLGDKRKTIRVKGRDIKRWRDFTRQLNAWDHQDE